MRTPQPRKGVGFMAVLRAFEFDYERISFALVLWRIYITYFSVNRLTKILVTEILKIQVPGRDNK